ncbi:hypothetical protein GCK32_015830, partial [Trichostrongylus colubriformis]
FVTLKITEFASDSYAQAFTFTYLTFTCLQLIYIHLGGRPRACTLGVEGNCPADHVCVPGEGMTPSGGTRHLCCRPEKVCIVPYVDITKKRPQRCFPGTLLCSSTTALVTGVFAFQLFSLKSNVLLIGTRLRKAHRRIKCLLSTSAC